MAIFRYSGVSHSIIFALMKLSLFLLTSLFLLSSCMMPLQPDPTVPNISMFQEGDIVITADGGVESWLFALGARSRARDIKTPFSHSEMIFRDTEDQLMIGGVFNGQVNAEPLADRFKKFHRTAIFRSVASANLRLKAALKLRQLLNDSHIKAAEFDYSMNYEPGRTDKLFCAGIINDAWQEVGLPPPFTMRRWQPNRLTEHLEEITGEKVTNLLDLDSIYTSPDFSLVLEWENDQINDRYTKGSEKIIRYLLTQYEQGFRLKASKGPQLLITLGGLSGGEEELARMRISLTLFGQDVLSTWRRLERRGKLTDLSEPQKDALVATIFAKYHEKYFYPANTLHNSSTP